MVQGGGQQQASKRLNPLVESSSNDDLVEPSSNDNLVKLSAKKAVSESGIDSKHCVNRSISGERSTRKPKDWTKRERTLGVI